MKQFNITINFDDYTVKTQMLSHAKDISVNNDRTYMWYAAQKIIETKGGYDGKLIHGTYRSFFLNNQLKEQGQIKYGLRNQEWKYWYADGKLKEVINWKKGVKKGSYYLYNDYGQLMAKGKFKEDKLNGWFYTYGPNGKFVDKKKYKKGDEVQTKVKTKKRFKLKLNFFKKKKKKEVIEEKPKEDKKPFFKRLFRKEKEAAKPETEIENKIITS
ncbi:toxin-antitoxin system YwqK family antitoxin [Aurantibacillus circumpalustris]|uniref:toxin-antitoxin system YwqK family antitoxin n=1 Tax=Aurantibacillus circumpalustris TaxID=3036359 RepID=UPI00295A8FA6|nr:hypothetical protein [Aurantibacillus circumpalustris]